VKRAAVRARRLGAVAALAACVAAAGCGASSDPNGEKLHDVEAAVRAIDRALGLQTAFITVGNFDTGATVENNATGLWGRVMTEASGCVTATHAGATVHATFATDCMLATASMRAGGTVDIVVDDDPAGGRHALFTVALTVDGQALAGDFEVATPTGQSFTYATTGLTLAGTTVVAPLVKAGIAGGGATLDAANATAGATPATAATPFALAAVHQRFGACYPDEGTASLGTLPVTFSSVTPQSGAVTLAGGNSATLPTRTGCPR
jgi:hypothetical protein